MNNSTTPKDAQVFSIIGEPASKANSRRAVVLGGKPRFIKSSKALGYSSMFKQQETDMLQPKEYDTAMFVRHKGPKVGTDYDVPAILHIF